MQYTPLSGCTGRLCLMIAAGRQKLPPSISKSCAVSMAFAWPGSCWSNGESTARKGVPEVLSSISGQNQPWTPPAGANWPSPLSPSGSVGGWDSTIGANSSSASATKTPVTGGMSTGLSDGMSFALLAFGNSQASRTAGSGSTASAQQASGPPSGQPGGSGLQSQLLADLQSLISTLTGGSGSAGSGANTSGSSGTSGTSADATTATARLGATLSADFQNIASDLNSIANGSPRQTATGHSHRHDSDDTSNTGSTNTGGTTAAGWNPNRGDYFQQRFAASAYAANATSDLTSPTSSILAGMNV